MLSAKVHVPELAFITLTAFSKESMDTFLGQYTVPVFAIQQGQSGSRSWLPYVAERVCISQSSLWVATYAHCRTYNTVVYPIWIAVMLYTVTFNHEICDESAINALQRH